MIFENIKLKIVVFIIIVFFLTVASSSFAALPGYQDVYGPLITPEQAHKILLDPKTAKTSTLAVKGSATASGEIKSLVRGLKNDPDLIYAYVHNHIRYTPVFGDVKGADATLTDKSGNDFDQASLMIAMLREAGFTANYVYGTIRLDPEEVLEWLGTDDIDVLLRLLPSAGIPIQLLTYPSGDLAYLNVDHVWVKANIDGTDYMFDPSLKRHTHHAGIDIKTTIGFDKSTFVSNALSGSSNGSGWVQNINRDAIRNNLSSMAMNLVNHVRTNIPDVTLNEVIGGSDIIPDTTVHRQTSLPYIFNIVDEWTQIPVNFKATLRIQLPGIDQTLFSSDIYGKRLTLFYNVTNQPELRLDGALLDTGSAVSSGVNQTISVTVDHPYANSGGSYADVSGTINIRSGGSFLIVNGWGEISSNMVDKHRKLLEQNRYSSNSEMPEPVLGQSLAMLSYLWLAECSRMDDLTEPLTQTEIIHHHWIGVCGQNESPYIDMPINLESVISLENDADMKTAVFVGSSGHHSAFEWGIIEQTQEDYSAVSTVKLLDDANEKSDKIFEANSSNFNTIKTMLKPGTYSSNELGHIQSYLDYGYRIIMPEDGNLGEGIWQGTGFLTISPSANSVGHIISGGLKGGFGTEVWDLNSGDMTDSCKDGQNSDKHEQSPEPIDLVTGSYLYAHADLKIGSNPSPLGLEFIRSYNSTDHLVKGPTGLGWTHNYDIRAARMSDGFQAMGEDSIIDAAAIITEIYVGSSVLTGGMTQDNLIIATIAHRWAMDGLIDNSVLILQPGISRRFVQLPDETFNGSADCGGVLLEILTDSSIRVTEKYGTAMLFNLDGTIGSITDTNSNGIDFSYASGDLSQVSCTSTGHIMSFTYTNGFLTQVEDSALRSVSYGYDPSGNLISFTDASGEQTTFEYSTDGMLSKIYYPTDPVIPFVQNLYDSIGKVITQTDAENHVYMYYFSGFRAEEENPDGKSKIWEFDNFGRTLAFFDALGNATRRVYDSSGRQVRFIYPLHNEIQYEYDAKHNILVERKIPVPGALEPPVEKVFTYHPVLNLPVSRTDTLGRVTNYSYDNNGNLLKVQYPAVNSIRPETNFVYNTHGQLTAITDSEGKVIQIDYDPVTGDLVSSINDPGGENIQVTFAYDAAGNNTGMTDPNGNTTEFNCNSLGKITSFILPGPFNYQGQFVYDKIGNLTQILRQDNTPGNTWQNWFRTYTPSFKTASTVDPENDTTRYEYDMVGRLWKVTDSENNTTEFIYDDAGRLVQKKNADNITEEAYTYTSNGQRASITDGNGNTSFFRYDGLGRLKEKEYPDSTVEVFQYDAADNLVRKQTRAGDIISFIYDSLNRPVSKTNSEKTVRYELDQNGRLTSVQDGAVSLVYSYDNARRLIRVERSDGKAIDKEYDNAGNLTKLVYPDGYFLTYTYDGLNRLQQILEMGTTVLVSYQYDSLSRRTAVNMGNGVATSVSYEPDNDVSEISYQFNGSHVVFDYSWNKLGDRISFSSTDDRFLYQPLGDESNTYTPNAMNQYAEINAGSFGYDLNGNLTATPNNSYVYDSENKLKQVITPYVNATYESDPLGRRQSKTVDTVRTDYFHDGSNVIMEYDDIGSMAKRFIYGLYIDEPVCMITPQGKYFYHADAQGSIAALSDDTGGLSESYAYSPFGEINQVGTSGNPYLYTGRRIDPETGLYYFRARHYDAQTGRFLQPDPIGIQGGINLYAFVKNNPVNLLDPLGLAWRQERPLDLWGLRGTTAGPLHHDRFLYDDDTESGYYSDSRVRDDNAPQDLIDKYENVGEYLEDDILKDAVNNVKPRWDRTEGSTIDEYGGLGHNCQDYADEVMAEYDRLKDEKDKAKQTERSGK